MNPGIRFFPEFHLEIEIPESFLNICVDLQKQERYEDTRCRG